MGLADGRLLPIPEISGRILVVGLGVTGLSCVRTLAPLGVAVAVVDSRDRPPGSAELQRDFPFVPICTGGFEQSWFDRADLVLLSPGVPVSTPQIAAAMSRGAPVWSDIELFSRLNDTTTLAVTGSNGKSTVTALLGAMAERSGARTGVGGNIGIPALGLLAEPADIRVLELSSFQLETTFSLDCAASAVLNVSPDHLDRYANLGEYAATKARVYQGGGVQVINVDDPLVAAMARPERKVVRFGLAVPEEGDFGTRRFRGEEWICRGNEAWLTVSSLGTPGRHNLSNALAALALGTAAGFRQDAMIFTLEKFPGLPHRTQLIGELDGVRFYDDSKGTNVGATVAAIRGLHAPIVLIAGGQGKGQDFAPLGAALTGVARGVVLMGEDGAAIREALPSHIPAHQVSSMEEAVNAASSMAQSGDIVLLSPACASFDMFSGFAARGEAFAAAVWELGL